MKKNKMIVAVIFTFALLTTLFAMSNGGSNDPVKEAQGVKQDTQAVANPDQSDQNKSNTTAKDWFGFDTGMTEKEFHEHQEAYIQRWIDFHESQVQVGKRVFKNETKEKEFYERMRKEAIISYQQRLNLNAIPNFKQFGIGPKDYFIGYDAQGVSPYTYATTISQVVVHGIVTSTGVDSTKYPIYVLKPIEIFKGNFYYDKLPENITVKVFGMFKEDQEIIAFLGINFNSRNIKNLKDIALETIGVPLWVKENSQVIDHYRSVLGNIDEIKATIKEIDKINNTINFYNIKF